MAEKVVSLTPKGGDALELLKLFENRANQEGISLPEVVIPSGELLEKFPRRVINLLISANLLRAD